MENDRDILIYKRAGADLGDSRPGYRYSVMLSRDDDSIVATPAGALEWSVYAHRQLIVTYSEVMLSNTPSVLCVTRAIILTRFPQMG